MKTLLSIENDLEKSFLSFPKELDLTLNKLEDYKFNLKELEITRAIIQRMRVYTMGQELIKKMINKRYAAPASDFFVETIAFYVSAFLKSKKSSIEVHSERQIKPKRGFMRPDISLWNGEEVVGIIECKTQLGYNRDKWSLQHKERKDRLAKTFPKAQSWLVVFSSSNWSGFENDPLVNKEYFTLANTHMRDLKKGNEKEEILNPIENLLKQLKF